MCVRVDDGLQKYLVEVIKGRRVVDFVFGLEEEAQLALQKKVGLEEEAQSAVQI